MKEEQLSTAELINKLKEEGIRVTHRQLVRWQNSGISLNPTKHSLGKGKGSVTVYPPSSVIRIKKIIQYLDNKRSLDQTLFEMWIDGDEVEVKRLFEKSIKKYKKAIDLYYEKEYDDIYLSEEANKYSESRLNSKILRTARKHIRRSGFPDLLEIILRLLTGITRTKSDEGSYTSILDDQIGILLKSFGQEYSPKVENQKTIYSWVRAQLDYLASVISLDKLSILLEHLSEEDLKVAYLFYKQVVDILSNDPAFQDTITPLFQNDIYQQSIFILWAAAFLNDPQTQSKFMIEPI